MRSMWIIRLIMVVLALTLAAVLIARGNVVIGALVGALAVTRLVMFATLMSRRRAFRQRFRERSGNQF